MEDFVYIFQIIIYVVASLYFIVLISSIFSKRIKDIFIKSDNFVILSFIILGLVLIDLLFLVLAHIINLDLGMNYTELIIRCCFIIALILGGIGVHRYIK